MWRSDTRPRPRRSRRIFWSLSERLSNMGAGGPAWSWPSRGSYTKIKLLTPAGEHTGRHSERNKLKISTPGVKPFRGGGPRETIHRAPRSCGNRRAHRPRQERARARADRDRPGPTEGRKAARDHDR